MNDTIYIGDIPVERDLLKKHQELITGRKDDYIPANSRWIVKADKDGQQQLYVQLDD